jgi:hypothetical protein
MRNEEKKIGKKYSEWCENEKVTSWLIVVGCDVKMRRKMFKKKMWNNIW